jgi:dCMP deaminase
MRQNLRTSPEGELLIRRDKAIKYYRLARYQANLFSKDPSTKVGALFLAPKSFEILSMGFNGMPRGVDESRAERWQRPIKYKYIEHAERNGLFNANRRGVAMDGAIAVVSLFPCADCARGMIQSGIQALVTMVPNLDDNRWDESFAVSLELLEEAGVHLIILTEEEVAETFPVPAAESVLSAANGWRSRFVSGVAKLLGVPV